MSKKCDDCVAVLMVLIAGYKGASCGSFAAGFEAKCIEDTLELEPDSGVVCTVLAAILFAACEAEGIDWVLNNAEKLAKEACKKAGLCP